MLVSGSLSDLLAILAVVLSAISLYVSYRTYRRDASHLHIRLRYDADPVHGDGYTVRITNDGRRPAAISRVFACEKSGKRYPVMDTVTRLAETEFHDLSVPMAGFGNGHPSVIRAFEVEDTTGRVYKAVTWPIWWRMPPGRAGQGIGR